MNIRFETESEFVKFKEELKSRLNKRELRRIDIPGFKDAAVMILFLNRENSPHILLTKRTDKVETHKGQISFPGGTSDEGDGDIISTAYRETYEEVGIPSEKIELIGQFDDFYSMAGFHVSTFVGAIEHPFEYRFSEDEIDDYVEAPLSIFLNQEYDRVENYNRFGKDYDVYYYYYKNFEIWGLTAKILTDFASSVCSG